MLSQVATTFVSVICPKMLHKLLHSKHRECHVWGHDKSDQREAMVFRTSVQDTTWEPCCVCCSTEFLGTTRTTAQGTEHRAEHATLSVSVPKAVKVISACPLGVVVCGQKLHCPYWLFKIITIVWLTKQQKLFVKKQKEELDKVSVGSGIL